MIQKIPTHIRYCKIAYKKIEEFFMEHELLSIAILEMNSGYFWICYGIDCGPFLRRRTYLAIDSKGFEIRCAGLPPLSSAAPRRAANDSFGGLAPGVSGW